MMLCLLIISSSCSILLWFMLKIASISDEKIEFFEQQKLKNFE